MKNQLEYDLDACMDELEKVYPEVRIVRNDDGYRSRVRKSLGFTLFVFRRRVLAFFEAIKNSFK